MLRRIAVLLVAMFALWATFPHAGDAAGKGPLSVGSKIDTEGALLGQMIVILLEHNGFDVKDRTALGATNVVRKALLEGEIDIYPEYTGNGFYFFDGVEPDAWTSPEKAYELVSRLDLEKNGVVWLKPAPANNTWAIAARKDISESENIRTLDDFADYVNGGGNVRLACSEEFASRPDVLPAFEKAYGFHLKSNQLLVLSGGNTAQTEQAASIGRDGVNFAMAYGTDGGVAALGLVILEDTREVQPVYEPAPVARNSVLEQWPEIAEILDPVFMSLDKETLQQLNARIAVEGMEPSAAAAQHLEAGGFMD